MRGDVGFDGLGYGHRLVRHRVDQVVDAVVIGERRHFRRIIRGVGVFPGVAHVGVGVDGDDDVAFGVGDFLPARDAVGADAAVAG